ncbi:FkbM family methyltransferase [Rhodobacteraceae bacterium RKSG542]|uniref:FkbM family methyltransferase n=1 Tax=Pseudovibrio flavus TaxID=2529854 RepID=UPI0012BBBA01|nr:FkbM family methyltransferase [Pseudovibrio flavus]MTI17013.1 FkbM family methyltransferase [Pseudovibrio flavus]
MKAIARLCNSIAKRSALVRDLEAEIALNRQLILRLQDATDYDPVSVILKSGLKVFLPNLPRDLIQRTMFRTCDFYERELLEAMDPLVPEGSTVIDIGANIGNHSLYWATQAKAARVIAFEPVAGIYGTLIGNIEANGLDEIIEAYPFALGDKGGRGAIYAYDPSNLGGTAIRSDQQGDLIITPLDDMDLGLERLDLMKIDVEGFELAVLKGAATTLKRFRPALFVESFEGEFAMVKQHLQDSGYRLFKDFGCNNYLFKAV